MNVAALLGTPPPPGPTWVMPPATIFGGGGSKPKPVWVSPVTGQPVYKTNRHFTATNYYAKPHRLSPPNKYETAIGQAVGASLGASAGLLGGPVAPFTVRAGAIIGTLAGPHVVNWVNPAGHPRGVPMASAYNPVRGVPGYPM